MTNRFWRHVAVATLLLVLAGCAAKRAFYEGERFMEQGRFEEAVLRYHEALAKEPDRTEYRLRLQQAREKAANRYMDDGRVLMKLGRYEEASRAFGQALALDPTQERARQEQTAARERMRLGQLLADAETMFRERKIALARQYVNEVLAIDPGHAQALELQEKIKAVRNVQVEGHELELDSGEPVTLKFKQTEIKDAFSVLSRLSGVTFIFDEGVKPQQVTVYLEKATFAQALELLLRLNNLDMKVLNPRTLIIFPNSRDKQKQYDDQVVQLFYLSNIDAKKAVNLLRTMLKLRNVYVHEELNALVIRDEPAVIKLCQQILEASDRADSEVVYDLEVVTVSHTDNLDIGPKLSSYSTKIFFNDAGTDSVLVSGLSNLDTYYTIPAITYNFAKSLTDSEILASPKIRVKNRDKAKVHIGSREPVITVTQNGDIITDNVQYVDVGVKLDVEPVVQLDGTVVTKLSVEVSEVADRQKTDSGTQVLTITTSNIQTALTLRDGEQTIIGGLIRDDKKKTKTTFPILGDIPIIGALISGYSDNKTKREILLSITPRIVRKLALPSMELATIWSGGEDDLRVGPNFGAFREQIAQESDPRPVSMTPAATVAPPPDPSAFAPLAVPPTMEVIAPGPPEPPVVPPAPLGGGETLPPGLAPEPGMSPALPPPAVPPAGPVPQTLPETPLAPAPASDPAISEVVLPPLVIPPGENMPRLFFSGTRLADVGEEFVVTARITGAAGLYSAPMFVNFDNRVLQFVRGEEAGFLQTPAAQAVFTVSPNPARGQLIIGYKQGTGATGANGDGELFRLFFRASARGTSPLQFDRVNLRDPGGVRIMAEAEPFAVEVR